MSTTLLPERAAQTPPAAPGRDAETWRCACGNVIGVVYRAWVYIRWKERDIAACLPVRVKCNRCGRKNVRDA